MVEAGFEPAKHTHAILSRAPLTKLGNPTKLLTARLELATLAS